MKQVLTVAVLAGALVFLGGCEEEGPMERAGEEVDQAVEDTGDAIEKGTDN